MPVENNLENILVSCLEETLNVLVCCESTLTLGVVNSSLCRYSTYNLFRARSLETVDAYLAQVPAWNCFIIDARFEFARDVVARIAGLGQWYPVIIIGDSPDSLPFFRSAGDIYLSTEGIVYCSLSSIRQFVRTVQELCIKKRLLAFHPDPMVAEAVDALFERHPVSVEDWASMVNSSPRKFQRLFKPVTDLSPKKIIALYHAYRIAFDAIEGRGHSPSLAPGVYEVDIHDRTRVMEYVLSRRNELLSD